jgi:hypothetical protein
MVEDEELLVAIDKSIEKWDYIKSLLNNSEAHPCALCELYFDDEECSCMDCPLSPETVENQFDNTICCDEWRTVNGSILNMCIRLKNERLAVLARINHLPDNYNKY